MRFGCREDGLSFKPLVKAILLNPGSKDSNSNSKFSEKLDFEKLPEIKNSEFSKEIKQEIFGFRRTPLKISHKRKLNKKFIFLFALFSIMLVLSSIFLFKTDWMKLTGFSVKETQSYEDFLNLSINESQDYSWELKNQGQLLNAKISGKIKLIGEGSVKIYLEDKLLLDSSKLEKTSLKQKIELDNSENKKNSYITGYAVDEQQAEETSEAQTNAEQDSASTSGETSEEELSTTQISNSEESSEKISPGETETEPSPEDTAPKETPVENPIKTPQADEQVPEENQTPEKEISEELEENKTIDNVTEILEYNETIKNESNQNYTQQLEENKTKEIENKTEEPKKNKTTMYEIDFSQVCGETCNLEEFNLSDSSYNIRIELENASLFLDSIVYDIKKISDAEENFTENETNITETNMTNMTDNVSETFLYENYRLLQDDPGFEVMIDSAFINNSDLLIDFHHTSLDSQQIKVKTNESLDYSLDKPVAAGNENISLDVFNYNDEYFELWVGNATEIIAFGNQKENITNITNITNISIIFDRILDCPRCGQHKAPPLTSVNMTISLEFEGALENITLADYFNKEWLVIDSNNGTIENLNETYNKISWNLGNIGKENETSKISQSYIIKSPERTLPPKKYDFYSGVISEKINQTSESWDVIIADPTNIATTYYFRGLSTTGNVSNRSLETSLGSTSANWRTTANNQQINFISTALSSSKNFSGSFPITFWCNRTASATLLIYKYEIFDCANSACTSRTLICSSGNINLNCNLAALTQRSSSSCSNATGWTVASGHYLEAVLYANTSTTRYLYVAFNSSTYPSHINATVVDLDPTASQGTNPLDNYNSTSTTIVFDAKCSDQDSTLSSLEIWANDTGAWHSLTTQTNPTNNTWYNLSVASLTPEKFVWASRCNDTSNNIAWSSNRTITIDSTNPIASQGTDPVAYYNDSDGSIVFDAKCSDNVGTSWLQIWTNSTGTWHANYSNSSYDVNNSWQNITLSDIPEGYHVWAVWCNDSLGNSNITTNKTFTVDKTSPNISNTQVNATSVYANEIICINATVTDAGGIDQAWASATTPSEIQINKTMSDTVSCAGIAGDNVYGVETSVGSTLGILTINTTYSNDSSGNLGYQTPFPNLQVQILSSAPNININWPINSTQHGTGIIYIVYNVTDNDNITNCSLINADSQAILQTSENVERDSIQTFNREILSETTVRININCTDILGNTGSSNILTFQTNSSKSDIYARIKDSNGYDLEANISLKQNDIELYNSSGTIHTLVVDDGLYNITITPNQTLNSMEFFNVNLSNNIARRLVDIDQPSEHTGFDSIFAVDPTAINFSDGTLTFTAASYALLKCTDWNFSTQSCQGNWTRLMTNLVLGQSYTISFQPGDPGYAFINITNAEHLDENRTLISNIYEQVKAKDDIWSEEIPSEHYVRVVFEQNLTNEKDITLFPRATSGTPAIEVYEKNETVKIAEFINLNSSAYNQILLTNLTGEQDTFDLKIVNGSLEFDHIIDPQVATVSVTSISAAAITENQVVIAYCDDTNDDISFQVFFTNGTVFTAETDADITAGACDFTSVGVSALNSTAFVIGWYDSIDADATFAVYNIDGTVITAATDANATVGVSNSVSVAAFNSTAFVISWIDRTTSYASFRTYTVSGTAISAQINVDTTAGSSNSTSVSAFNSTALVFAWFDAAANDACFRTYTVSGTAISAVVCPDATATSGQSVSVSAMNSTAFIFGWFDGGSSDASYEMLTVSGGSFTSGDDSDTDVGTSYSTYVAALNDTSHVVVWYDQSTDTGIQASTYTYDTAMSGLKYVQNASVKYASVTNYYPATNIRFCNLDGDKFIVALVNTTSQTNFHQYYSNGSLWSGNCYDPPAIASFGTNPVNTYNSTSSTIVFDAKCSDDAGTSWLQIWGNWTGTWHANYTNSSYDVNDSWQNITISNIPTGTNHRWAVWCNDSVGGSNITTNRTFKVDATDVSACRNLITENTTYTLTQNVSSAGTCFNVLANNITLDCNGYSINYSTTAGAGTKYGVVSGYNSTTIKNCFVYEGAATSSGGSYGILISGFSSNVTNNTVETLKTSSVAESMNFGTFGNHSITGNTIRAKNNAIYLNNYDGSSISNVSGNTITLSDSSNARGIYLNNNATANLTNNVITGSAWCGICIGITNFTKIINNAISLSSGNSGLELSSSNGLTMNDSSISCSSCTKKEIFYRGDCFENNFTNVTFSLATYESAPQATGKLNVFWYLDVYTNDSGGSPVEGANVTIENVSAILINWSLTNSSGYIPRLVLRQFMQNSTSRYYETNYTINSSKAGYENDSKKVNLTDNAIDGDLGKVVLTLSLPGDEINPIASFGTDPVAYYNDTDGSIVFDTKCSDDAGTSWLQIWGNWTGTWHANYTNSSYDVNNSWQNITLSDIPEGYYVWAVYCNDTSGNSNITINRTFMVDSTAPTITLPLYTNATKKKNTDSLTFNVSVVDSGVGPSFCSINVDGQTNQTVAVSSGWCNGTYALTGIADGNQTINAYANDTANNLALNNSFVVWLDSTNPIASQGTDPVAYYNDSDGSIVFDAKCSDNAGTSWLQIWTNSTGTWHANYSNSSYDVNNSWQNITLSDIPEGYHAWAVWCNDTAGGTNITTNKTFTVDKTSPISSFGTNPVDTYNDSDGSIDFELKCSDNIEPDFLQLWGNWTTPCTGSLVCAGGNNNYTLCSGCSQCDFSGITCEGSLDCTQLNEQQCGELSSICKLEPTCMNRDAMSCLNANMEECELLENYNGGCITNGICAEKVGGSCGNCSTQETCSTSCASMGCSWNPWKANQTNSSPINNTIWTITVAGIPEGFFVWAVYCNDTSGNSNITINRTFMVDSTAPTITLPSYTNATKKKNTDSLTFNVSVVDSGSGPGFCSINVDGQTNQTVAVSSGWCNGTYSLSGIADGNQTINAYANDTANNLALNNSFVVWLDSTNPIASQGTDPVAYYNDSDGSIVFDAKCSDNVGTSWLQIWTNSTGTWHANYSNSSYDVNNSWQNITISDIPEGYHVWAVWCNDTAGGTNITTNRTFTVDKTSPTITLPLYTNATKKKNTDSLTFNVSVVDSGSGPGFCSINVDGQTNQTVAVSSGWCNGTYSLSGIANGNKTINAYANDTANNLALNNSFVVWLDSTAPTVSNTQVNGSDVFTGALICINANSEDSGTGIDAVWVLITWPNGTVTNYSDATVMTDAGSTSCDGGAGDNVYGVEINVGNTAGTFVVNTTYANDTAGNLNSEDPWPVLNVTVTSSAVAPTIDDILDLSIQNITESSVTNVEFYVNVSDLQGYATIDTVNATFSLTGEESRYNSSCVFVANLNDTQANYSCIVGIWYWDGSGNWTINVTANDSSGLISSDYNETFELSRTTSFVVSPDELTFAVITPGTENVTSNNDPTLMNNTGNADIPLNYVSLMALDLYGEDNKSYFIKSINFSISIETGSDAECAGDSLENNSYVNITGSILTAGNNSLNYGNETSGQEQLYYCIKKIDSSLIAQAYSTDYLGSWTLKILALALIVPLKKRRSKNKYNLKTSIDEEKLFTILKLSIEEIKERYSLSSEEIIKIAENKAEETIPLSVFEEQLGALESIVKYLKENLNLPYNKIAKLLNRDDRTVWITYRNSLKKKKEKLDAKPGRFSIPLSIFSNRKLSILESLVLYLKEKNLSFKEISKLIRRDQRNIWTINSRANKKLRVSEHRNV